MVQQFGESSLGQLTGSGSCLTTWKSFWLFGMCTLLFHLDHMCLTDSSAFLVSISGFRVLIFTSNVGTNCGQMFSGHVCVRGRECRSVCLSMCLHCHEGFDLCTSCYWLPVICWSRILTNTDILVWRSWASKQQPVNISQGRYEGCDFTQQLQLQSLRPVSPVLNIYGPSKVSVILGNY